MKRTIISIIVGAALATAGMIAIPAPAQAQAAGTITCEAVSSYATGYGWSYDGNVACRIALRQCAVRTPYGYTCYVNRWWYN